MSATRTTGQSLMKKWKKLMRWCDMNLKPIFGVLLIFLVGCGQEPLPLDAMFDSYHRQINQTQNSLNKCYQQLHDCKEITPEKIAWYGGACRLIITNGEKPIIPPEYGYSIIMPAHTWNLTTDQIEVRQWEDDAWHYWLAC